MERRIKVPAFAVEYVDAVSARDWRGTLRGWQDFAVSKDGDQTAFDLPKGPMIKARVKDGIRSSTENAVQMGGSFETKSVIVHARHTTPHPED